MKNDTTTTPPAQDALALQPQQTAPAPAKAKRPAHSGVELIAGERLRQMAVEGFALEADRRYLKGELAHAGASYAALSAGQSKIGTYDVVAIEPPKLWPWPQSAWKPSNSRIKNLVRAGALIAAEIDRLLAAGEAIPEMGGPAAEEPESAASE